MGRRVERLMLGSLRENFGYDLAGNMVYHTNFNGVVITNQYDIGGRLTNRLAPGGSLASFTYTDWGARATMTDAGGTTTYSYDGARRLVRKETPQGTLNYAHNRAGNVTNIWSDNYATTYSGISMTYQYDAQARLTNTACDPGAVSYRFDSVGNVQMIEYASVATNFCQYDALNRLTNMTWGRTVEPYGTLATFQYKVGVTGLRTNLVETIDISPTAINNSYTWQYDTLYRLTNETMSGTTAGTMAYSMDMVGNRTNRTGSLGELEEQNNAFDFNNRLASDLYDKNGNTLTFNSQPSTINCLYDVENRLTNAYVNGINIKYVYNGDGLRVAKIADGVTNLYLWDDKNPTGYPQVVEEAVMTSTETNVAVYYYGLALFCSLDVSGVHFQGLDGHGNVRFLMDDMGNVTDTYTYDAYGTVVSSTGDTDNRMGYAGEYFDKDLGMSYNRARWYRPGIGRFLTSDEYEGNQQDPISLHKFHYTHCNPVNLTDPSGMAVREVPSDFELGNLVEDVVAADFSIQRPASLANTSIHRILDKLPGYKGVGRLRPDFTDSIAYEIYDCKSWGEAHAGIAKVELYVGVLQRTDINPDPNRGRWHPGNTYRMSNPVFQVPGKPRIYAQVNPSFAGVISYKLYQIDNDEERRYIPVPVKVPEELRRLFRDTHEEREWRFAPQLVSNAAKHTVLVGVAAITGHAIANAMMRAQIIPILRF